MKVYMEVLDFCEVIFILLRIDPLQTHYGFILLTIGQWLSTEDISNHAATEDLRSQLIRGLNGANPIANELRDFITTFFSSADLESSVNITELDARLLRSVCLMADKVQETQNSQFIIEYAGVSHNLAYDLQSYSPWLKPLDAALLKMFVEKWSSLINDAVAGQITQWAEEQIAPLSFMRRLWLRSFSSNGASRLRGEFRKIVVDKAGNIIDGRLRRGFALRARRPVNVRSIF